MVSITIILFVLCREPLWASVCVRARAPVCACMRRGQGDQVDNIFTFYLYYIMRATMVYYFKCHKENRDI